MIQVLEGENAVAKNRELMGATNPADAAQAQSAPTLQNLSASMLCTVLTVWKTLRLKLPASSAKSEICPR